MRVFRKFWGLFLVAVLAAWVATLDVGPLEAGTTKYSDLGDILTGTSDTTAAWDARYNGAGFLCTWTDEDSITVAIQSTIDGVTWFTLQTVTIDGGTTGPFAVRRAITAVDFANTSGFSAAGGAISNLPLGFQARAIITSAGSDTCQDVKFAFLFAS